jgi:hypothetical protein
MDRVKALLVYVLVATALAGANQGCSSSAASRGDSPRGADSFGGPLTRSVSTVHPGQRDVTNRYLPSVGVRTPAKREDGQDNCSGVLISPHVVVTAGHCVCRKRKLAEADKRKVAASVDKAFSPNSSKEKSALLNEVLEEATTIIDKSSCAELSIISVMTYPPSTGTQGTRDGVDLSYSVNEYKGDVLPHDDLMILYDENNWTVFKEVDLAVVILRNPVRGLARTATLAKSEVRTDEFVVMAGYGLGEDDENAKIYGDRYSGESQVLRVAESGSGNVQFLTGGQARNGGMAANVYRGDSGAPCFRRSGRAELLGIASAQTEDDEGNKLSVFTSIYPHREWLKKIVSEAGAAAR